MSNFTYLDTNTGRKNESLDTLFPGWHGPDERVMVYCGHDDDAILGASYVIQACVADGAQVYVTIACNGHCGYSTPEEKDTIVDRRREEAYRGYEVLGVPRDHVLRLELPDFSAASYVGLFIDENKREGHFRRTITNLRRNKITRILTTNPYHEHSDHTAAYLMGAYDAPQAGDAHSVDWAEPYPVKSVAMYSCWAEFDPEDAMVCGRDVDVRANVVVAAAPCIEDKTIESISAFPSQEAIIEDLCAQRAGRKLPDGRFLECYIKYDPRPKFNYEPYKKLF